MQRLKTNKLIKAYKNRRVVNQVSIEVKQGEIVGLLGPNGAGKTTTFYMVVGLIRPDMGQVLLDQEDLTTYPMYMRAQRGISYLPQEPSIFRKLTVEENIRTGFFASRKSHKQVPDEIYQLFPVLKDMRHRRGGDLSGGQQQQLAIARALVLEPKLLLMDEPAEGIQPTIVQEIGDVIQRLNTERNITVLLVEQKLPFARRVGDYFCIMERGKNVATGEMSDLSDELVQKFLTV